MSDLLSDLQSIEKLRNLLNDFNGGNIFIVGFINQKKDSYVGVQGLF